VWARIEHGWRVLATGFFFAALFGGGAVLAFAGVPLVNLFTPAGPMRRARFQHSVHLLFRFYVWLLQRFRLLTLTVEGGERLAACSGRMVIANHPSLLDVVLIMALTERTQCIVKRELWESRYLGGVMRGAGYIRNDLEPEPMLEACRTAIAEGECLIIFPEGTRTTPGEPLKFRRGFANLATHLDMTIQLVTITCDPPTLVKGEKWWKVPMRRPHFRVHVGDSIESTDWTRGEVRSLATRKLVRFLEAYYTQRLTAASASERV
jgi:1-acyl-sn-glycerol-3-phosphate acyltransferase